MQEITGSVYGDPSVVQKVMSNVQKNTIENILHALSEPDQIRIIRSLKEKYRERN